MTTPTTPTSAMTRGDSLTGFLAVVLLVALAMRRVEEGWPTGMTVLVTVGAALAAVAPAVRLVTRYRAAARVQ